MSERHGTTPQPLLLSEEFAWFVASMVAILVYTMCAMVGAPTWAFIWLLAVPLLFAWRMIVRA